MAVSKLMPCFRSLVRFFRPSQVNSTSTVSNYKYVYTLHRFFSGNASQNCSFGPLVGRAVDFEVAGGRSCNPQTAPYLYSFALFTLSYN